MDLDSIKRVQCIDNRGTYPGKFVIGQVYKVKSISKRQFSSLRTGQHSIIIDAKGTPGLITGGFHVSRKSYLEAGIRSYEHTGFIPVEDETYDIY